jgi:hypothetical protein
MSKDHGDVYCAGCHDSPHAIAPSREANDGIKFVALQGDNGPLDTCIVCHAVAPAGTGPHGMAAPTVRDFTFEPDRFGVQEPGAHAVYTHTLRNIGNVSDTYGVEWTTSQAWADVVMKVGGSISTLPVTLMSGDAAIVEVTVTVPSTETVRGSIDRTVVTATSLLNPSLAKTVSDVTLVPRAYAYLPIIARQQ